MRFALALIAAACTTAPSPRDGGPVSEGSTPVTTAPADAVGRCLYVNTFSQADECKEYLGSGWSTDDAAADCTVPMPGAVAGTFEAGVACDRSEILGECIVGDGTPEHHVLVFPGGYGDSCDGLELGCTFAGGTFVPSPVCDGATGGGGGGGATVFRPFEQVCTDPLPGEPPGLSADGQVCTWQAVSGATEAGRQFADYADCGVVITQRPYWPAAVSADTDPDDPRLSDDAWLAEYDWASEQVEATACVCCHTEAHSPGGAPSGWYLEAAPIWVDTLDDDALAMMAGWVDSTVFGAFPPEENNGFDRHTTGVPTTDPARMQAFFEGELDRRGLVPADFDETEPFGGPLYDQLLFEPEACPAGSGVDADGVLTWAGGDARYLYVLEADADAPGVPPNLDLPAGTLWRVDVDWQAAPVPSGVVYGEVPAGAFQAWPEDGAPTPLRSGETYYLYALADVYLPLTRCLFTAP